MRRPDGGSQPGISPALRCVPAGVGRESARAVPPRRARSVSTAKEVQDGRQRLATGFARPQWPCSSCFAFASPALAQDHGKPGKAIPSPMIVPAKTGRNSPPGLSRRTGRSRPITSPQKVTVPLDSCRTDRAGQVESRRVTLQWWRDTAILLEGSVGTVRPAVNQPVRC